jgi:hypothetical protein
VRHVCLVFAVLLLHLGVAGAQTGSTGQIRGRVEDQAHLPVSATVTASRADGSFRRQVTSRADGSFTIALLPPGTYQLQVQKLGYQPVMVREVAVSADHVSQLTVGMTRAAATLSAVVVEAPRVTIKRGDTQFETEVGASTIAAMPIGLDIDRAVALTPGARPNQMWGGATAQANNYQFDGMSMNHPGVGGRAFEPNVSWIQQLEVRGLGAGAEYGDFQGGLVDVVTKSGSNTPEGFARAHFETSRLNNSGLTSTIIVPEVADRAEVEAEHRGPIIHDRLFYYISGQYLNTTSHAVNHLGVRGQPSPFYSPVQEASDEHKVFGKLTWAPASTDLFNLSLAHLGTNTTHYALSGRETPDATSRYAAPTFMYNGAWDHQFSHNAGALHFSLSGSRGYEHVDPYNSLDTPGIATFQLATSRGYQNAPFTEHRSPTDDGGKLTWRASTGTGAVRHELTLGGEYSVGTWKDDRTRNGGMTWRPRYYAPIDLKFDPTNGLTWDKQIPLDVGGEVHLHTRTTNAAAFVQDEMTAGRITFTPGLRVGSWSGRIAAPTPNMYTEVDAHGLDPRVGMVLDLSRDRGPAPTFVLKAHWGRYHQGMFAEMFDRAAGSQAYTDQNLWEYEGPLFQDPTTTFSQTQLDSLQQAGALKLLEHADLAETGAVVNYKQPYMDQFVGGVEKTFGSRFKIEALYVRRDNHDQIGLVDKNAANDWVTFDNVALQTSGVAALGAAGLPLYDQNGNPLALGTLYIPTWAILQDLRQWAAMTAIDPSYFRGPLKIPGYSFADTARISWNPKYELTTIPEAQRHFQQVQLNTTMSGDSWDALLSVAWTDLRGNFASVTGYDEYTIYGRDGVTGRGPGPYVRPNEAINNSGRLEHFSPLEVKLRASMALGWRLRAGAFASSTTGDPITPFVSLTPLGINYLAEGLDTLPEQLLAAVAGQRVYTAPRGSYGYRPRVNLDLHLERDFGAELRPWTVSLDVFNVFNDRSVLLQNAALEAQVDPSYPVKYASPLQRVEPRRIRIGTEYHF